MARLKVDGDDSAVDLGWIYGSAFYSWTNQNIDFTSPTARMTTGGARDIAAAELGGAMLLAVRRSRG